MGLHRLTDITIGVPNVDETARYYTDFGLTRADGPSEPDGHRFRSLDGGAQLRIVHRPARQLLSLGVGAQNPDDIDRISASLARLGIAAQPAEGGLQAVEPATGLRVDVWVALPIEQAPIPATPYNAPGAIERSGARSAALHRTGRVRSRKLGHVVFGSVHVLGCRRRRRDRPGRHRHARRSRGLGRHYIGSNVFWYLRDPAGNFSEYYSDLDCILDDQLWEPGVVAGERGLYAWGPPPPPSFLHPDDLADLMIGAHQ